jgi:signal peptidase II
MLQFTPKPSNIASILLLILIDQATKYLAYCYFLPTLPFIKWNLIFNTGVSFGIAANLPVMLIISCQIVFWLYLINAFPFSNFYILISAGFLSNLLDRFTYGGVLDFIHIHHSKISLPFSFNIADLYISIAGLYLLLTVYKTPNRTGNIN